jgi:hypothetical protein
MARALLTATLFLACGLAQAQERWRHVADFTDTRAMIAVDGRLVTASTRGGVLHPVAGGTWEHVSFPQGMLAVDLVDVCTDGAGTLFWAGADASLSARGLHDGAWSRGFLEFREHPQIRAINDLWGGGGTVLVAHSIGLTRFDYLAEDDEYLVRWNLHALGDFPQQSPVLAATAFGDWLVAVTANGLVWGAGWPAPPASMQSWARPGNLVTVDRAWLAAGEERLYALLQDPLGAAWAGSMGLDGQWRTELAGLSQPLALAAKGSSWVLALASGTGSRVLQDGGQHQSSLGQRVGALAYEGGTLWAALLPGGEGGGLVALADDGWGEPLRPDLPGAEEFVDLEVAADGSLWAVGVASDNRRNGLYRLRPEGGWQAGKLGYDYFGNYPTSIACDRHGGVWFGSWGRGCSRLLPDLPEPQVKKFSWDAGPAHRMAGFANAQVGEGPTFPLVSDLQEDAAGNLWIVNHQALDDSCLVVVPAAWYADSSTAFARKHFPQIGLRFPWGILPTPTLGVWAGVAGKDSRDERKRLLQLSSRGLPVSRLAEWRLDQHELADANWNFGLAAPGVVNGLAVDASDNLWLATSDGFYVGGIYGGLAQFSRVQFLEGLLSEQVEALTADGRGRVWLGADAGLSVYEPQAALFRNPVVAAELNSLLRRAEGFQLNAVRIMPDGALWVAGNLGLFTCGTGARDYGRAPAGTARMYPNPFRPDGLRRARLLPEGLANDATIVLYDASGRRVRKLSLLEAEEGWDGRDDGGALVGSGVYLILVSSDGGSAEGKIAVIR